MYNKYIDFNGTSRANGIEFCDREDDLEKCIKSKKKKERVESRPTATQKCPLSN